MNEAFDPTLLEVETDTRYGRMTYYSIDHFIGQSLELYGEYSPDETAFLSRIVKPGWVVVNGGANIGSLTLPLAKMVGPEGSVYAFEPQPEAFKLLAKNTRQHNNIQVSDRGLWDVETENFMPSYKEMGHKNLGGVFVGPGSIKIPLTTLDRYMAGGRVDLIFLDIEGAEVRALRGAAETIKTFRPVLYLEDHPDQQGQSELSAYCRSLNYLCFSHKPSLFSRDNFKSKAENVFAIPGELLRRGTEVVSFNLLCIPQERIQDYRDIVDEQATLLHDRPKAALQAVVPKAPSIGRSTKWAAIARMGGVGDNLIAASVCRPLKELGYSVEVITQKPNHVLFENNPHVDKISAYGEGAWPKDLDKWQDWFRMRSKEYERFANLSHSCECRHALFPIQTWFWWSAEMRRKICGGNYLETVHDIVGVEHRFGPVFFPTDEEKEQARVTRSKMSGPVIGWCVSGSRIDKVYPYTPLIIARLIKELGATVVMLAAPPPHRDYDIVKLTQESVRAQNGTDGGLFHAGSLSLANETWPVRRILTFAAQCDAYVGFDTGPSWGVAFEPVPKVILLGHASEENITKHWVNTVTLHADRKRVPCWPCHQLHNTFETCNPIKVNDGDFAACISDINGESIIQSVRKALEEKIDG